MFDLCEVGERDAGLFPLFGKMPKSVTRWSQLARGELDRFIEESAGPGAELGVLLVQFAPRKMFVKSGAEFLFRVLRERTSAALGCEGSEFGERSGARGVQQDRDSSSFS